MSEGGGGVNREQLATLLADAIIANDELDGWDMNWHEKAAAELVDKLWPVLAQVWEEGYKAGQSDEGERLGYSGGPMPDETSNPYGEAPR